MYRKVILGVNTLGECTTAIGLMLALEAPPSGPLLKHQEHQSGRDYLHMYVGPAMMLPMGLLSLFALVFKETESKALFATLAYAHIYLGIHLALYKYNGWRHFMVPDPLEGAVFHVVVGIASLMSLIPPELTNVRSVDGLSLARHLGCSHDGWHIDPIQDQAREEKHLKLDKRIVWISYLTQQTGAFCSPFSFSMLAVNSKFQSRISVTYPLRVQGVASGNK
jgi:hypothetical protein